MTLSDVKNSDEPSPQSVELFRLLVENVTDYAIFMTDAKGTVISWNPGVETLLGYTENEIVGQPIDVIFTREDRAAGVPQTEMETAVKTGRAEEKRWQRRKDGSRFWANGLMMSLKNDDGSLRGFAKIMRHENAIRPLEENLRESEEKYRTLFERIDSGFCIIEMLYNEAGEPVDWRFLEANPAFEKNNSIKNVTGKTITEIVPNIESKWFEIYGRVARTGEPERFVEGSDALGVWFDVYAFRLGSAKENRLAVLFNDITRQKIAEAERERLLKVIEADRARLAYIFENAPAFVTILRGAEHTYELTNPAYQQLIGHRDVIGKTVREALPELAGQGYYELLDSVYETGEPFVGKESSVEFQYQPSSPPEKRFVNFVFQPMFDSDGKADGIFVHGVDITAQVEARRQAEAANRLKDEFLATISHELRTPLNAILGWAKIINAGKLDAEGVARASETIVRSARSQSQLIEDLLDISRIISGKMRLDARPVELPPLIESVLESVRLAAEAKDIRIHTVLDPRAAAITGDSERLQQIFWNLLTNAIKFTPRGGKVQVQLDRINSHLEFIVSDTGNGIEPEFLPHIFERFRQSDGSITKSGGLGLGLAIVKSLVELHGGSIHAASKGSGKGSTFTVVLPLRIISPLHSPDIAAEHPAVSLDVPLEILPVLDGVSLVVVDDEGDSRLLLKEFLMQSGAQVALCASADEAFVAVQSVRPHALISDIGMPGEDGYSLIRRIRKLKPEQGGQTPAIALTAYTRVEDRVKALASGFQMFIPKPLEPAELIAAAKSLAEIGKNRN